MAITFPKNINPNSPEFEFYQAVINTPILQGVLVENIEFAASGTVKIKHKLDRPYKGFLTVRRTNAMSFYDSSDNTRRDSEIWIVNPLGSIETASFWIF